MTEIPSDDAGELDRCPACGAAIGPGAAGRAGEAHCPGCGQRLWFAKVRPGGELVIELECAGTRPAHLDEIIGQFPRGGRALDLVLDFQEVRGIYSIDLAKLITLKKQVHAAGGDLKIRNLHPDLLEIFKITRLDEVFDLKA